MLSSSVLEVGWGEEMISRLVCGICEVRSGEISARVIRVERRSAPRWSRDITMDDGND